MGGGRGRSGRTQRKHFKQSRENVWKRSKSDPQSASADETTTSGNNNGEENSNTTWQPLATQNAAFEEYYKVQGIVTAEEWDTFIDFLRKPLPAAFRINSSGQFCTDIRLQLENDFVKTLQEEFTGGDEAEAIRPLPWYPDNLAWHSNFSRNQLRKNQTLARFHEFLKLANEIGNITRQEAVSMVPPLFLDVQPEQFVLDMCAAPGSKTFQLLEIIHKSSELRELPSGMVVANDVDVQRSNLLIHQTKRMCTANLIVTNHEAQNFPGCNLKKHHYKVSDARATEALNMNQLLFDRVLCDVPCSGDGTLRKAPDMWRKWNVGMGNGLHSLQLQIAMRGISLLKVGGRMVYSTCSMNPVENEAVVAEILRRCKDSVELVDVSTELPELIRRPGLKRWKVRDKGCWLSSYKDVKMHRRSGILPGMFPSGRSEIDVSDNSHTNDPESEEMQEIGVDANSENVSCADSIDEETSSLPLERCMRVVPHDQNTGAFFIAVFRKHSPFPTAQEKIDDLDGMHEQISSEVTNEVKQVSDTVVGREEKLPEATLEVHEPDKSALGEEPCQTSETDGSEYQQAQIPVAKVSNDQHAPESEGTGTEKAGTKRKLQMQGRWKGVDPVVLFKDETIINSIKTFYGIIDSFPLYGHLVSRNSDNNHVKRIYYISKSVKDVLELNFRAGYQLKIASVGLKMLERQTSREGTSSLCSFRISSEGLPLILPFITKQILLASAVDFKHLLQYKSVKFGDFVDAEMGEKASQLELGGCVIVLREAGQCLSNPIKVSSSTIAIGCWKGRSSVSVMVNATDCQDLLERLVKRLEANGVSEEKAMLSEEAMASRSSGFDYNSDKLTSASMKQYLRMTPQPPKDLPKMDPTDMEAMLKRSMIARKQKKKKGESSAGARGAATPESVPRVPQTPGSRGPSASTASAEPIVVDVEVSPTEAAALASRSPRSRKRSLAEEVAQEEREVRRVRIASLRKEGQPSSSVGEASSILSDVFGQMSRFERLEGITQLLSDVLAPVLTSEAKEGRRIQADLDAFEGRRAITASELTDARSKLSAIEAEKMELRQVADQAKKDKEVAEAEVRRLKEENAKLRDSEDQERMDKWEVMKHALDLQSKLVGYEDRIIQRYESSAYFRQLMYNYGGQFMGEGFARCRRKVLQNLGGLENRSLLPPPGGFDTWEEFDSEQAEDDELAAQDQDFQPVLDKSLISAPLPALSSPYRVQSYPEVEDIWAREKTAAAGAGPAGT